MNRKEKIVIISLVLFIIGLGIASYFVFFKKDNTTSTEVITNVNEENANDMDTNIDFSGLSENKIELGSSDVTITNAGIYYISGTLNGKIIVNSNGNIKLVLESVTINSSDGPAINILNAENIYIELVGTNNISATTNDEYDGAIYSSDNLLIYGDGTLNITSNYDGIVSKDNLVIKSGIYNIDSMDDGIRGKDSVLINDGTFNINSKGDGIKTTNDTDSSKGTIYVENGIFNITSYLDGISSINSITIKNGSFNITSGSENNSTTDSTKGIKATNNILILNGTFIIDAVDDAIHSNSAIKIENGTFNITSRDDGIHADNTINILDGNIDIKNSYEGIEASYIIILDGDINVIASDDGINVSGGANQSENIRMDEFAVTDGYLNISGGTIYINSNGDGLDSNGSINISGGTVYVDGPTNNGNGALDYNGTFKITGGTLIAVGSSGMAQNVSNTSTQNSILINLGVSYTGDISFGDITYSPKKSYQSILISSSKLELNKEYNLIINGTNIGTYTLTSTVSLSGNQNGMQGGIGGIKREDRR